MQVIARIPCAKPKPANRYGATVAFRWSEYHAIRSGDHSVPQGIRRLVSLRHLARSFRMKLDTNDVHIGWEVRPGHSLYMSNLAGLVDVDLKEHVDEFRLHREAWGQVFEDLAGVEPFERHGHPRNAEASGDLVRKVHARSEPSYDCGHLTDRA